MRRLTITLSIVLVTAAFVSADEATDLRDRALKAFAKDPADVKKMRMHTLKGKGVFKNGAETASVTFQASAVWPGQVRFYWDFVTGSTTNSILIIGNDDRGWRKIGSGGVAELNIEEQNDLRADSYAMWVSTLSTLSDADSKLSTAAPAKVNGDPAVALKVTRRSFPDITLYFDEKTGLLHKMAYRAREAGVTLSKEMIYEGHKNVNGLMLPSKQTILIQGREAFAYGELEYAFPDKIEPKLFEKP
jgi:hypothetical protein